MLTDEYRQFHPGDDFPRNTVFIFFAIERVLLKMLTIEKEYLSQLKEIVITLLKDEDVKIVLFGSRARGDNHRFSDVDIGIIPLGKLRAERITLLKEKVEDLNIPYKVEIVNLSEVSESFRTEALKDVVVWKG